MKIHVCLKEKKRNSVKTTQVKKKKEKKRKEKKRKKKRNKCCSSQFERTMHSRWK